MAKKKPTKANKAEIAAKVAEIRAKSVRAREARLGQTSQGGQPTPFSGQIRSRRSGHR